MSSEPTELSRIFPVYYISDYVFSIYFATLLFGIFLLWQLWFRWKVKINCWFCGYDNIIPRYSKLWWKCTTCDQFNGFKKNGDYQKEVPEMHDDLSYTPPKFCANQNMKTTNMLCSNCSQNQTYIIEALREFEPTNEKYFTEELEYYKAELNSRYDLCVSCRTNVTYYIQDQNQHLVQTYNNDLNQQMRKSEKGLRKLNVKLGSPNTWLFFVYKIFHLLSLLAVIWLWNQNRLSTMSDLVLFSSCLTFICSTSLLYLYANTLSLVGCFVSFLWTFILLYGNFKTRDSKYLRKVLLAVLVFVEVLYLGYVIICLSVNLWKWITYKQERKVKIDKIRESPKVKLEKVHTPPKTDSTTKPKLSPKRKAQKTSIPRRPSTPDLLEGHLDAMYIQRKEQNDISPAKDKDTNHVVAALRYSSSPQPPVNHRASGQILRPAMFSFKSPSPKKFSPGLLRPSLFETPRKKPSTSSDIFNISQIQISDSERQTNSEPVRKRKRSVNTISKPSSADKVEEKRTVREIMPDEKPARRYCTWSSFVIFVLIFSLVCNFILALKITSIGEKWFS